MSASFNSTLDVIGLLVLYYGVPFGITIAYNALPKERFCFSDISPPVVKWWVKSLWLPGILFLLALSFSFLVHRRFEYVLFHLVQYSAIIPLGITAILMYISKPKPENTTVVTPEPAIPEPITPPPPKPSIPDNLRTQHHWVVAPPGWGKSQLFQSMILDDLETDAAIVVIDSQNDLINNLATRVPDDRLILIDPATCPPALNVFATGSQNLTSSVALLSYAFEALGAEMTSKQQVVFGYLCRYLLSTPSTMATFIEALQNPTSVAGMASMGVTERAFYNDYSQPKGQYNETRQEVLRRLLAVLEDKTFQSMLMADEMSIDVGKALDSGKVILINTAKSFMGQKQAVLFGRLWIAQILQVVMARQGSRRRTYLYLDEFADYASDDPIFLDLFRQTRKFELGMIVAHQTLSDLPEKLRSVMMGTTAIKMCGGVSAQDAATFAKQMRVDVHHIEAVTRGTFATHYRDVGFRRYPVEFGRLEKVQRLNGLKAIQAEMRELYGPKSRQRENNYSPSPPPASLKNPESGPSPAGRAVGKSFIVED